MTILPGVVRAHATLRYRALWIPAVLGACLIWSYWPTITELFEFWGSNDDYSVGQLVPFVALYLLWRERQNFQAARIHPNWWGLVLVVVSQLLRFAGIYYAYASAERLSLVVAVSGMIVLVGGWTIWRRTIWIQMFLLLMLPPPRRIHNLISLPLQDWATSVGLVGLELLGFFVMREGNVLNFNDHTNVMVAEACSGLRMLTAFVFTASVLSFLIRRPVWQKVVLLASSIPIAIIANGLRVFATSIFVYYTSDTTLEERFHDLAGLLMMPLAVLTLLAELKLLALVVSPRGSQVAVARRRVAAGSRR